MQSPCSCCAIALQLLCNLIPITTTYHITTLTTVRLNEDGYDADESGKRKTYKGLRDVWGTKVCAISFLIPIISLRGSLACHLSTDRSTVNLKNFSSIQHSSIVELFCSRGDRPAIRPSGRRVGARLRALRDAVWRGGNDCVVCV
jgi:hypothetical protein